MDETDRPDTRPGRLLAALDHGEDADATVGQDRRDRVALVQALVVFALVAERVVIEIELLQRGPSLTSPG
mgnify:CR=1 FL=1